MDTTHSNDYSRRRFLGQMTMAGSAALFAPSLANKLSAPTWTVGQIMDLFMNEVPGGPMSQTVDTLKAGNRDIVVTGIVTTMFATIDVIRKAVNAKANFIIAHEPTFYNHTDKTDWLEQDPVFHYKQELLAKNNIAVWRNHDHIHRHEPDGVRTGVADLLGWRNYLVKGNERIAIIPAAPLGDIIEQVKKKMGIPTLRYIGDLKQSCSRILFNPGFNDGGNVITAIQREKPDLVMGGEMHEWEVPEYIRDARLSGQFVSLIIQGHAMSEEPGSEYMATWLRGKVTGIPVTHIPAGNPLSFS